MDLFNDKRTKNDIILVIFALIAAFALWFFIESSKTEGAFAVVIVNGTETARYPLDEDMKVTLENGNGGYNILVIEDGQCYISEADCFNQVCVNTGRKSRVGDAIVCMPHKIAVNIIAK